MALIDINWKPSPNELRVFAVLQLIFFTVVCWLFLPSGWATVKWAILGTSGVVALLGLILPSLLQPLYVVWMAAAFPIGWVVSHTIMAVVFYVLFTVVGLIMKVCGYDPLRRNLDRQAKTYWQRRTVDSSTGRYFRQF